MLRAFTIANLNNEPCRSNRKRMTAGVSGRGLIDEQQIERQMGCMAGFFQMFDRSQILSGKRHYPARRLTSCPGLGSTPPSERSDASTLSVLEENQPFLLSEPSPEMLPQDDTPPRPSLPLPLSLFDFKDSMRTSWKISEVPRLSVDSRAMLDATGKFRRRDIQTAVRVSLSNRADGSESAWSETQRQSPSVVARLMGLDALPVNDGATVPANNPQLRRSASVTRVTIDQSCRRFIDLSSFEKPSSKEPIPISAEDFFKKVNVANFRVTTGTKKPDVLPQRSVVHPPLQSRSFFNAQDFFPDPERPGSVYSNIENRLPRRGVDELGRNLETLKQILEALQLKGLLHSNHSGQDANRRDLMYDDNSRISGDSRIVHMKRMSRPPRRTLSESSSPPARSFAWRRSPSVSPNHSPQVRRDPRSVDLAHDQINRTSRSRDIPSSPARRRTTSSPELRKRPPSQGRPNTVGSPKVSAKMFSSPVAVRSPRIQRQTTPEASSNGRMFFPPEDETSTTISDSSRIAASHTEFERSWTEEYRSGRNLLDRCDNLVDSIAALATEQQPSPMSVLDSSNFFRGGESSPSPMAVTKRSIDFTDRHGQLVEEWEDDHWNQSTPNGSNNEEWIEADEDDGDVDYAYVSKIVRLFNRNANAGSDEVYAAIEKRPCAPHASKASRLHRRLVFDTVAEILDRKRQVSPWETFARVRSVVLDAPAEVGTLFRHVYGELRRIRVQVDTDDLNGVTCGAIRKDMEWDGRVDRGWGPHPAAAEMSDGVLHIERQLFKDLVADAIRDLVEDSIKSSRPSASRRKLVF